MKGLGISFVYLEKTNISWEIELKQSFVYLAGLAPGFGKFESWDSVGFLIPLCDKYFPGANCPPEFKSVDIFFCQLRVNLVRRDADKCHDFFPAKIGLGI